MAAATAPTRVTLEQFNELPLAEAAAALLACCAAPSWAAAVAARRPFRTLKDLCGEAEAAADSIAEGEWLVAFAAHPRIGDREALRTRAGWSGDEQSGVDAASRELLHAFAQDNAEYERRFGFVFLICATGRTGPDMHAALRARLANTRDEELANAVREHRAITELRLRKLVHSERG